MAHSPPLVGEGCDGSKSSTMVPRWKQDSRVSASVYSCFLCLRACAKAKIMKLAIRSPQLGAKAWGTGGNAG
eukprot:scaffold30140_cov28-Tisochrysis_lutea.AAC.2